MKRYIAQRLLWTVFATFVIMTVTFILMTLAPNQQLTAAKFQAAQQGADVQKVAQSIKEKRGLTRPLHVRYVDFMLNIFRGNWGWSFEYQKTVRAVIFDALPYSLMYGIPAVILSSIIGVVVGLYSAVNQYTKKDYVATLGAFFGVSIPNFWFGIVLLVLFAGVYDIFPLSFDPAIAKQVGPNNNLHWAWLQKAGSEHPAFTGTSFEGKRYVGILSPGNLWQLVLPVFVLMTGSVASITRYARAEALEYVDAEFVKTAKSKGVSERAITFKHIFRPASIPLTTILVGRVLGLILVSSYLLEVVFGIPGIGLAQYRAIIAQDTDLVAITFLIPTMLVILGNFIEDIAYGILDPRIDIGDNL